MLRFISRIGLLGAVAALAGAACSTGSDCDFGLCAGPTVGTTTAVGPDGGTVNVVVDTPPPAGCNTTADPVSADASSCVADSFALFVDASASSGDGTRGHPFSTIGAALGAVPSSGKRRIYVCGTSTFAERLQMSAANAANIHGGFACGTWTVDGSKPIIAPTDVGYALQVANVPDTRGLIVSDIGIVSLDAASAPSSTSSVAVFLNASTVTLLRVDVSANRGAPGAAGVAGAEGKLTSVNIGGIAQAAPYSGHGDTAVSAPGREINCTCDTTGTAKSTGAGGGTSNGAGADGMPSYGSLTAGKGGTAACSVGQTGAAGPSGAPAAALTSNGVLAALTGWTPAKGASATETGSIGGGGGGGGGQTNSKYGGGGGCGGCANGPGTGGDGGGASIGIIAIGSTLIFNASTIRTADGGLGGAGGSGGTGGSGSAPGTGIDAIGCAGGTGGQGGAGGGGAGGAGGLSVGILFDKSTLQNVDNTSSAISIGAAGGKGTGGLKGTNDGPIGVAQKVADYAALPH